MFKSELEKILDKATRLGASYADARFQRFDHELIEVDNKALKSYSSRRLSGVGIRVAVDGSSGYASTSDLSLNGLTTALESALKVAKSIKSEGWTGEELPINEDNVRLPVKTDPIDVPPEDKVSLALDANKAAWTSDEIKNTTTRLGLSRDLRSFMSTTGADVSVETMLLGLGHSSIAKAGEVMEVAFNHESRCAGWEFIDSQDWNAFTEDVSDLVMEAVRSDTAPPGTYPVVVEPEVVGLVLHEAFGHATEGDIVSTGGSVLRNRLGTRVASDHVSVIDDGTIEGGFFHPYDDEGVKKGRTVLVEEGILKNYILDQSSAQQLEAESTGNGRAQDFENIPIVRQTNYYMEPGDQSLEELVEDIKFGILVRGKGSRGGQVEPGMGAFTFGVGPSKIIRDGELAETVRGVVISGMILETLRTVDAVGRDFKMRTSVFGGCGKMGQQVKVGMGGPPIRVLKMTVGGR